jgi:hypothetical protein
LQFEVPRRFRLQSTPQKIAILSILFIPSKNSGFRQDEQDRLDRSKPTNGCLMRFLSKTLLLTVFFSGCGQSERETPPEPIVKPKASDAKLPAPDPAQELSRDEAKAMLPKAASVSYEEFSRILDSPPMSIGEIENQSLTVLLLAVDPVQAVEQNPNAIGDFQYLAPNGQGPDPRMIQAAILGHGETDFVSLIQPEYITNCTCQNRGDAAEGHVEYRAGNVYAGSADFTAKRQEDHWEIVAFHLPEYRLTTRRDPDGRWRLESEEQLLGIADP